MQKIQSKIIVFITGAFVHHSCWDEWRKYFESQGYKTIAPPWPHKEDDAATLRSRQPDRAVAGVNLPQLLDHYTGIIQQLPEKPILMGHSFGGLITQVLLNKGLAAAGVAIHSVPPKGIMPYEINFLKSNAAALGFFTPIYKTYLMSFKKWQFVFTNGLSLKEQQEGYDKIAIPESKWALRGGLTNDAKVDFKKPQPPLLILAGANDHCIPAHLNKRNYKGYKNNSVVDFVVKERNHFVLGLPTWKEDAEYIKNWLV